MFYYASEGRSPDWCVLTMCCMLFTCFLILQCLTMWYMLFTCCLQAFMLFYIVLQPGRQLFLYFFYIFACRCLQFVYNFSHMFNSFLLHFNMFCYVLLCFAKICYVLQVLEKAQLAISVKQLDNALKPYAFEGRSPD